jgi:hypothetical protein
MAEVVAGDVFTVLHELDREASVRAAVIADAKAFDDGPGLDSQGFGTGDGIGGKG